MTDLEVPSAEFGSTLDSVAVNPLESVPAHDRDRRSRRTLRSPRGAGLRARRRERPWWPTEVGAALAFYGVYWAVRDWHGSTSMADQTALAARHGRSVLHLEQFFHLDVELDIQHWALEHRGLLVAMDVVYGSLHFLVTIAVFAGLLFFAPPQVFRRARNALALTTAVALAVFALFPTMPPRLLPPEFGYQDTLTTVGGLWSYNSGVLEHISDPFAAMPSLHMAWSTWCAVSVGLLVARRRSRVLLALYPMAIAAIVLATGTHWLLDLVAGLAVFGLSWRITRPRAARVGPAAPVTAPADAPAGRTTG